MSQSITINFESPDEINILTIEREIQRMTFYTQLVDTIGEKNDQNSTFSINGEAVRYDDLYYYLEDNMTIQITRRATRGLFQLSYTGSGAQLELKSKLPNRPTITINTVHLSCQSDPFTAVKRMTGIILYSHNDQMDFRLNGRHCKSGYILIKESNKIEHIASTLGVVHGRLFKWFFGIDPNPNFVCGGFSITNGKVEFNSGTFNGTLNDSYHDNAKGMHRFEKALIKYVIETIYKTGHWRTSPNLPIEKSKLDQMV